MICSSVYSANEGLPFLTPPPVPQPPPNPLYSVDVFVDKVNSLEPGGEFKIVFLLLVEGQEVAGSHRKSQEVTGRCGKSQEVCVDEAADLGPFIG